MREILTRGKRLDNGEWVEGYYVCLNGKEHRIYGGYAETDCGDYYPDWWTVDPATVGQYTGLKDKNGKRIFEGDIVNGLHLFERPVRSVVAFKDGAFGLEWNRGNVKEFNAFTSICNVTYEVVGNVYDNPELVGGTE